MCKEIGEYWGLNIVEKYDNIGTAVALNSARACLRYIIKSFGITEVYLPYYTCPVIWQAVQKEHCKMKFYHIDSNFMPIGDFKADDFILYTNYFGICAKNVKTLAQKYKNLIVDNAHAFYMTKYGIASFNSIRKFFNVSDGALVYIDKMLNEDIEQDMSYQRISYLLKKIDGGTAFGYADFCQNEENLSNEPIKKISNLTKALFNSMDLEKAKTKRLENFHFLNTYLAETNELKITLDSDDVPMVYPYLNRTPGLRDRLTKHHIHVPHYWRVMSKKFTEWTFPEYIIPLPIDQRYGTDEMNWILKVILEEHFQK